jgi:hypothetical protein
MSRIAQLAPSILVPRIVGNDILLGKGVRLASIVARAGLWTANVPCDESVAALLSAADGRAIGSDDRPVRAIKAATHAMLAGRRDAAEDAPSAGQFGALDDAGTDRLAKAFTPDEPRDDRGRWTDGGGCKDIATGEPTRLPVADNAPTALPVNAVTPATDAEKEKFTDDHLADAQKLADKLHVPVENILGLSAFESGWGRKDFAAEGNNYLGIHYPAPYATGYVTAAESKAKVATFASYGDCLESFFAKYGKLVDGVSDPQRFADILQNSKAFGIIRTVPKTGPTFQMSP